MAALFLNLSCGAYFGNFPDAGIRGCFRRVYIVLRASLRVFGWSGRRGGFVLFLPRAAKFRALVCIVRSDGVLLRPRRLSAALRLLRMGRIRRRRTASFVRAFRCAAQPTGGLRGCESARLRCVFLRGVGAACALRLARRRSRLARLPWNLLRHAALERRGNLGACWHVFSAAPAFDVIAGNSAPFRRFAPFCGNARRGAALFALRRACGSAAASVELFRVCGDRRVCGVFL